MSKYFPSKRRVAQAVITSSVIGLLTVSAAAAQPYGKGGNFTLAPPKSAAKANAATKTEAPRTTPNVAETGTPIPVTETAAAPAEAPAPTVR
jgi:hypothetical protein